MTHTESRLHLKNGKASKHTFSASFAAVPRTDRYFVGFVSGCTESYACSTVFFIKTNKAKFTQEQATKAQRKRRGTPLLFL